MSGEYEMPSPATRPEDDPYSVGREERLALPAQAGGGLLSDSELLDQFSAHPSWELSMDSDPPCGDPPDWLVHSCSGGRNDREWVLIGRGRTVREAITAAIRRTA